MLTEIRRQTTTGSSWLDTLLLGFGAVANLYMPVVDMDLLSEVVEKQQTASRTRRRMTPLMAFDDDLDGYTSFGEEESSVPLVAF